MSPKDAVANIQYIIDRVHMYRQTFNMMRTKSPNLNVCHLVLHLSLSNLVRPGIKSRMEMSALLQLHLCNQQFYYLLRGVIFQIFDGMHSFEWNLMVQIGIHLPLLSCCKVICSLAPHIVACLTMKLLIISTIVLDLTGGKKPYIFHAIQTTFIKI